MNILVLGGDGFIGSHLVDRVFAPGHNVTVFDRFQDNVSKNLEHLQGKIRFFSGEFADSDRLAKALAVEQGRAVETGRKGRIAKFGPGQTRRLILTLRPGKYVLICNLPAHYKAGQFASFRVI